MKSKWFWIFMLLLAVCLMVIGFITQDIRMWIVALAIGLLIHYQAHDILFGKYEKRLQVKREAYEKMRRKKQQKENSDPSL
ncbi:hypothetical protein [Heyndrickxia ginsengihumi]|uniref:hypothetical protein n=1 Tax=Heyndrickxia ginsengihumi TaxID=363870 RepID=UPI001DCF79C5|nr:hypothetical protein [Heyndrickxia ginsengihumi]MBE6185551.1 hypothetical protein [Bacillus sp. (in: firmicutes)]MCM3023020.1 hypothetical protein [Heyndrickxia ginsengihumi]